MPFLAVTKLHNVYKRWAHCSVSSVAMNVVWSASVCDARAPDLILQPVLA